MLDNPLLITALIATGVALNLGFFFTQAMTRDIAVTVFGTFVRTQHPAAYWAWRVFYFASFTFNMLLALAVIVGLLQ